MGSEKRLSSQFIGIRCTRREKDLVVAAAGVTGMSVSGFVRWAALTQAAACPLFGPTVQVVQEGQK